jgi:hypothetical protein
LLFHFFKIIYVYSIILIKEKRGLAYKKPFLATFLASWFGSDQNIFWLSF